MPLGTVEIEESGSNLTATVSFNLAPDTPPGEYWITVCNDPCTTGIGDLIGGVIYVGVDPPAETESDDGSPPAEAAIATTRDPSAHQALSLRLGLAPSPSRPTQLSPIWIGFSAALGGAVLLAALLSRQRN